MTSRQPLTRNSGPSGWTECSGTEYDIAGWEIFEGAQDDPNSCRGWFRCTDPSFAVRKRAQLRLHLLDVHGHERVVDVAIVHVSSLEPIWEFLAVR